jgi:hypothetical protein
MSNLAIFSTKILSLIALIAAIYFLVIGFSTQGRIPQIIGLLLLIISNQYIGIVMRSRR